jgi:hypothetical protein
MKFCIKCGIGLPEEAIFCSKCGIRQPIMPYDMGDVTSTNQNQADPEYLNSPQIPNMTQPPFMPQPQQQIIPPPTFYNPPNAQGFYPQMQQPQFVPQNPPQYFQPAQVPPYFDPQQAFLQQTFENSEKRVKTTLFFVWSIILIFIFNPLGTPLAIISTIFAGMARSSDTTAEQAQKNIKAAKIMCIIATCIDVLCIIALFVLFFYSVGIGNKIIPFGDGTQV